MKINSISKLDAAVRGARKQRDARKVEVLVCAGTGCLASGSLAVMDALEKKFAPLARLQKINLIMDIPGSLPVINMDPSQMISALSHLVENAFEAMPSGGDLTIRIEVEGDHLAIALEDTGCGIPHDQLDSVYDPFVTSKPRGAGMGLTMVHQIIMNHRGEIRIRSEINKGTLVTILLPIPVV